MTWKEEAAEKLRKLPVMVQATELIPRELARLELEARALQSGTGKLGGRNLRAQENRLLDNMIRRRELQDLCSSAESWVAITDSALGRLTPREKTLLTRLYVEGADVVSVCRELEIERSSLYRHRDAALRKLTLALYGALES